MWMPPAGTGGAWGLSLGLVGPPDAGGSLPVVVQALDRLGRPLAGVTIQADAGGTPVEGTTGPDGHLLISLAVTRPNGPWVVRVRSGSVETRRLLFLQDATVPGHLPTAVLSAHADLALRTGDVRRISIEARPGTLAAGGAESARVVVGLQDQSGNPVTDVPVDIKASEGEVGRARLTEDGTFVADYTPPPRMPYGDVELSVAGPNDEWSAHTQVQILPRTVRRAPGLAAGWLVGPKGIHSPWGDLELDTRLPLVPRGVLGRVQAGLYGARSTVIDDLTGEQVVVKMVVVPVELGLLGRLERGRWAGWLGGGGVLAPYNLVAIYGTTVATRGWGLARPGGEAVVGGGFRIGGSELQLQAAWLAVSLPPSDVGFSGAVGGARLGVGWKLLY